MHSFSSQLFNDLQVDFYQEIPFSPFWNERVENWEGKLNQIWEEIEGKKMQNLNRNKNAYGGCYTLYTYGYWLIVCALSLPAEYWHIIENGINGICLYIYAHTLHKCTHILMALSAQYEHICTLYTYINGGRKNATTAVAAKLAAYKSLIFIHEHVKRYLSFTIVCRWFVADALSSQ